MAQLTIQTAIDLLKKRLAAATPDDRPKLLVALPVPGNLGVAALTNAKPDDPDGLLIEAAGRPVTALQLVVHLEAMLGGRDRDPSAAYTFPGVNGKSSHTMSSYSKLYVRGPGKTEQVEVDGEMVGRYVADPIEPVDSL